MADGAYTAGYIIGFLWGMTAIVGLPVALLVMLWLWGRRVWPTLHGWEPTGMPDPHDPPVAQPDGGLEEMTGWTGETVVFPVDTEDEA